MVKTFVLTDESINSYGFWLPMSGAQIEQFKANPIMLWMHNRSWRGTADEVLPLGIWVNIRIEKGQLLADAEFDEDDEFARKIAKKVEKGILRMASVGIIALEWSEDPKAMKPGQTRPTVTKWKVREASIVDIGSNDNALAFYDEAGNALNLSQDTADFCPVPLLIQSVEGNQTQFTMKEVLSELNLADGSTELQAKEAIVTLKGKVTAAEEAKTKAETELADYKKKDDEAKKKEAVDLTDAAIKDGRIDAKAKESFLSLFEKDHEAAKISLASIPKRTSVAGKVGGESEDDETKKLAAMSWDDLDKQGKLAYVKANNWDLYAEKFKAKFGREPKK